MLISKTHLLKNSFSIRMVMYTNLFTAGHFTQMVWKGSKEMGIGKAKTSGNKCIVVASYRPAGNIVGHFMENVAPLKK